MSLTMGTRYEAVVEGGTRAETARKAAEEVAGHQEQSADIRMDLVVVKAMLGTLVSGVAALVIHTVF